MTTAITLPEDTRPAPSNQMLAGGRSFGVSTENFDQGIAAYAPEHQEILSWWFHLAKEKEWSLADLSRVTGLSSTTITRVFRGIYSAPIEPHIETLLRKRASFDESVSNPDFIMTSLAKLMFAAFAKTRSLKTVTIMWGKKGIGKTINMKEYTGANRQQTYYMRCPGNGCTTYQFICLLAKTLHISTSKQHTLSLREKIGRYLGRGQRLLIIDELHEIFLNCNPRAVIQICEWLRELYDENEFGLVLVGTEVMYKSFFDGEYADVLSQLVDRGMIQIPLSDKPSKTDITSLVSHYGLGMPEPGAEEAAIVNDILASSGLRKLTLHLKDGKFHAVRCGEPYQWEHFCKAHKALVSLQRRK